MNAINFAELKALDSQPTPKTSCANCSMHALCLPKGLERLEVEKLDKVIGRRRRVKRDESLYKRNDPFRNLYAIRFGHVKTYHVNAAGDAQITGFHMAGDLLGMDAIGGAHHSDAVALEDSEVCEIPFARLEELFSELPALLRHFHRTMSQEIMREQNVMLLLGNMRAEQRFAVFLVNLASRYAMRGYASTRLQLRMSREEIGNYLGLTIESISRLLSRFKSLGLLQVDKREITLLDLAKMKSLAAGADSGN